MRLGMRLCLGAARGRATIALRLAGTAIAHVPRRWVDTGTWNDSLTWSDVA